MVCRSNKRANIYNKGIRAQILWREDELNTGDLLMVAKNNYFWTEKEKEMDFIANGETAVVRRVRRTRELYGFRFADVTLVFPDYNDFELEVNMLLDTLHTDSPALPKAENDRLFYSVLEDYADITVKRERMKKMKADPYYNALQVKYAYAVTCQQGAGRAVEECISGPGLYDGRIFDTRLLSLALYGFYPCHGNALLGELSERTNRLKKRGVPMQYSGIFVFCR